MCLQIKQRRIDEQRPTQRAAILLLKYNVKSNCFNSEQIQRICDKLQEISLTAETVCINRTSSAQEALYDLIS